jgi:hypothetical protein
VLVAESILNTYVTNDVQSPLILERGIGGTPMDPGVPVTT